MSWMLPSRNLQMCYVRCAADRHAKREKSQDEIVAHRVIASGVQRESSLLRERSVSCCSSEAALSVRTTSHATLQLLQEGNGHDTGSPLDG